MGAFLGLLSALSIGFADLFARRVLREASPFVTSFMISVFAALTSIGAVVAFGSSMRAADFVVGIVSGVGMGVGIAAYYGANASRGIETNLRFRSIRRPIRRANHDLLPCRSTLRRHCHHRHFVNVSGRQCGRRLPLL